jgi:hypothetical protein
VRPTAIRTKPGYFRRLLRAALPAPAFVLLAAALAAQTEAVARLDASRVETGNAFVLRLAVPHEAGQPDSIDFSAWDKIFPRQNILSQSGWTKGAQYWNNSLTMIAFDSAVIRLPPLTIRLPQGKTARTNLVTLRVYPTASPNEVDAMADIKDIRREPAHWTDYWPWAAAAAAFTVVALFLRRLLARPKPKRTDVTSRTVELPAHQRALKRLDALAREGLWQAGKVKEYYAELTGILREYLEKRYRILALESTSAEIIRDLRSADFPDHLVGTVEELLQQADLAKFAKGIPPEQYHEQALANVREFVVATQPVESV